MLNSVEGLKKLILCIYTLIVLALCFLMGQMLAKADMPINEVLIKGEYRHIDGDQINLIANEYLVGNFFTINLKNTQKAFKKLPWVRDISVRRKWPDKLIINIEEHKVLGRWRNLGLVNNHGEIFNAAFQEDLPIFYGKEALVKEITNKYYEINEILGKELMQIGTITLSNRLSWEITTNNGLKIILGRDKIIVKLESFINQYQEVLYKMKNRIEYVDLRYKDGFSVRVVDESMANPNKEKTIL